MRKKLFMLFCLFTMLLCVLPVTAGADVGPKDEATIYLMNPPAGSYYIDLLYINDYESRLYTPNEYRYTAGADGALLHPADEAALRDAAPEGWMFVMLDGTPRRPGRGSTTMPTSSSTVISVYRMRSASSSRMKAACRSASRSSARCSSNPSTMTARPTR